MFVLIGLAGGIVGRFVGNIGKVLFRVDDLLARPLGYGSRDY